jgi:hypothetical protein
MSDQHDCLEDGCQYDGADSNRASMFCIWCGLTREDLE